MAITPKSEDKYVEKCSTAQSFIRTEMSTYRIGTLADGIGKRFSNFSCMLLDPNIFSQLEFELF